MAQFKYVVKARSPARYVVTAERQQSGSGSPSYTQPIGDPTTPFYFTPHDVVKGIVLGGAGYCFAKLCGVKMDPVAGALAGLGSGLIGGFEDISDATVGQVHDLPHELLQSGLLNIGLSTLTSVLLSLLIG